MATWVTLKSGEVRKYNDGGAFDYAEEFTYIRNAPEDRDRNYCIAKIRTADISIIEFREPCEVTWQPNRVDKAVTIVLTRARGITEWYSKGKLAELSRLLRNFNPKTREWTR